MTEQNSLKTDSLQISDAAIHTRKPLSIVWFVPLAAILIGGWLVYKTLSERGPTITINFDSVEGLIADKTKIKYKDVEVGKVGAIDLSDDLSHVIVTAKLVKGAEDYLTDKTLFWVVRTRISAGQVSGIGTLFSGAYIAIDPGREGPPMKAFKGLESPPTVASDQPGQLFTLQAETLGSLEAGSPVYYRQIRVGHVDSYALAKDLRGVNINIFIKDPHHRLVRRNTRFWNAGGLDITVGANGFTLNTPSFTSLMIGGISFENPMGLASDEPAGPDHLFPLCNNYQEALQKIYTIKSHWVLNFDGSVRGLATGAPVEFRGIKIGQVLDIHMQLAVNSNGFHIPILIEIEPERFMNTKEITSEQQKRNIIDEFVSKGLRAQLKTGNLLTGQLFIDFALYPNEPPQSIDWNKRYPAFPTIQTPLEEISVIMKKVIDRLEGLPIEEIGNNAQSLIKNLNDTVKHLKVLVRKVNVELEPEAMATLMQARKTLDSMEQTLNSESPLSQEARQALEELARAARSISIMADYIERHPDAFIFGKGKNQ